MNLLKLIFIDIDGTLIRKDQIIPKENIKIIRKLTKLGYKIILASGRPYCASIQVYKKLRLNSFLITDNGATISNPKDKKFKQITNIMDESLFKKLFLDIKKYTYSALYNINDAVYIYNDNKSLEYVKHGAKKKTTFVGDFTIFNTSPSGVLYLINKADVLPFEDVVDKNYKMFGKRFWGIYQDNALYEIFQKNISKGNGAKIVSDLLNIPLDNAICFGDGENDIELFKLCKVSVAMKNASDNVKENATHQTEFENYNSGIYHFIVNNYKY